VRLCNTPKTQIANHLVHLCIWDQPENAFVSDWIDLPFDQVAHWIADQSNSLASRSCAAWMLSGVGLHAPNSPQRHPEADFRRLLWAVDDLGLSASDVLLLEHGVRLTQTPLPIVAVLIGREHNQSNPEFLSDSFPGERVMSGIPDWAFDQHTRIGKQALRHAVVEIPALNNWANSAGLSKAQAIRAFSSAHFEAETALLLLRARIQVHLELYTRVKEVGAYRTPRTAKVLYDALAESWEAFSEIRGSLIVQHLNDEGVSYD